MKLVISIPVHEKPDVIKNQIENFRKYLNNPIIVLHVSKVFFEQYSIQDLKQIYGVYVNPKHLDTKWGDIIHAHISNYEFIREIVDFDYFVFHSSNDMYIRYGFEEYIQKYEAGFNIRKVINRNSHWWPGNAAFKDIQLAKLMNICGQTMIIASQIESSFYSKNLMEHIYKILKYLNYVPSKDLVYTREEIYFPTIASSLVSWDRIGNTTTFSEVHRFDRQLWRLRNITRTLFWGLKLNRWFSENMYWKLEKVYNDWLFKSKFYKTTVFTVRRLLLPDRKYILANSYLNDGSGQFQLYDGNIFSVKRIRRDISDPVRKYITNLS